MKDRFKFRVWCRTLKQFQYFQFDLKEGSSLPHSNWYNEKEPIQQCTGLKDRNGKLIYEGDLLKTRFGLILKVYWREQSAMFWLETLDGVIPFTFYAKQQLDGDLMEVIGNIYENKELLREQKC